MTEDERGHFQTIIHTLHDQTEAMVELTRHVTALNGLTHSYTIQAQTLGEIRADLAAIETRQAALIAQITSITTTAIQSTRPSYMIQVGGFVLAVTLLILNLLGYSAGFTHGRLEITRTLSPEEANHSGRGVAK
jgi:hypothetical protein